MNNYTSKISVQLVLVLLFTCTISMAQKNIGISLEQATKNIQVETKGKVLSAKTKYVNGKSSHHVRVLTPSGRVKSYRVPVYDIDHKKGEKNQNKERNNFLKQNPNYRDTQRKNKNDRQVKPTKKINRNDIRKNRSSIPNSHKRSNVIPKNSGKMTSSKGASNKK